MPAYKDEERGTWYCMFYYKDWTGKNRKKKKRGFKLKKDAQEWERDFLSKQAKSCDMRFGAFVELYMEYSAKRHRPSTMENKRNLIDTHILPYFKDKALNAITPTDILNWQNKLLDGEYRPTYLRSIHSRLSAIFNHAVRFYDLPGNPCRKAGTIGSKKPETIDFWTLDEFRQFIPTIADKPRGKLGIEILYWSGLRIGELLSLCPPDLLKKDGEYSIRVDSTWQMIEGAEHDGPPKTETSERIVPIPRFLGERMEAYMAMLYECPDDERIFYPVTDAFFEKEMERGCAASGVKKIRLHDLRHSHVSLLIHLGYDFITIAQRIGHKDVRYVMETYGHLYPQKHKEVVRQLEQVEAEGESLDNTDDNKNVEPK